MISKKRRFSWLGAIGLTLLLAACSTPIDSVTPTAIRAATRAATRAVPAASVPPVIVQPSPTILPPTQPPATAAPAEAAITPTTSVVELPSCESPAPLTPAQTEGPYYTPNTPERTSLIEPGMSGTKLIVTGYVLTPDCQPIANVWLDFWQADDQGVYDNTGYKLRGHLFTDESGRYTLETILPGEYPGRTEHIHVKVQAPNGPILTSQIYFPGAAANDRDAIFDPALLAEMRDTADGKVATFNFVVRP